MSVSVPFKATSSDALRPARAYKGDAGYDLCATEALELKPFERRLIKTGLQIEIPEGYGGFVLPRSGLALRQGLSLVNTPGLIDSNYRGELGVIAINLDSQEPIKIEVGDRIAQLVIMRVEDVDFVEADTLAESQRGDGGFGSSGVALHS